MANELSASEGKPQCYDIKDTDVQWTDKTCTGWRLPTEAEREYLARGGESFKYAGSNDFAEVAWVDTNSDMQTHPVCALQLNGYGLCDMSGNVEEWVWDRYGLYSAASATDPEGNTSSTIIGRAYGEDSLERVYRGGSWDVAREISRVSRRFSRPPDHRRIYLGFRLVRITN